MKMPFVLGLLALIVNTTCFAIESPTEPAEPPAPTGVVETESATTEISVADLADQLQKEQVIREEVQKQLREERAEFLKVLKAMQEEAAELRKKVEAQEVKTENVEEPNAPKARRLYKVYDIEDDSNVAKLVHRWETRDGWSFPLMRNNYGRETPFNGATDAPADLDRKAEWKALPYVLPNGVEVSGWAKRVK